MTSDTWTRVALFLIGSSLAGATPTFAQNVPVTRLMVFVDDYATVPPGILERAREETVRIFRRIDVEIVWLKSGDARLEDPSVLQSVFVVHILPSEMARRVQDYDRHMGAAVRGTRFVRVFYRAIESISRESEPILSVRRDTQTASILGHVVAHELGHLLLTATTHSRSGLMQAGLNFRLAVLRRLFFTESQAEEIRTKLGSRDF